MLPAYFVSLASDQLVHVVESNRLSRSIGMWIFGAGCLARPVRLILCGGVHVALLSKRGWLEWQRSYRAMVCASGDVVGLGVNG